MDEQPAPEEGAELALDEMGQADPVGTRGGRGEEGLQVLPDDPVQDRVDGSAWGVSSHGARPSGFRAVAATRPQDARTTYTPGRSRRRGETPAATEPCEGPPPRPRRGGGVDRSPACGRSSPLTPFSKPRDAQGGM